MILAAALSVILLYALPAVPFVLGVGISASIVIIVATSIGGGLFGYVAKLISDAFLLCIKKPKNIKESTTKINTTLDAEITLEGLERKKEIEIPAPTQGLAECERENIASDHRFEVLDEGTALRLRLE